MDLQQLPLPEFFKKQYAQYQNLTPIQEKALQAGVLEGKSLLICSPTASGKTLVATMAIVNALSQHKSEGEGEQSVKESENESERKKTGTKAIYLVPLKALAGEKYREYQHLFAETSYKVILSTGDVDSESGYLQGYDLLILTTEKLDSLLRHRVSWLSEVETVVVDEIHLLNDTHRGPTLEVILTLLKTLIQPQLIGLSATIGNPEQLANWLAAELVIDTWRPVELKQGIYCQGKVEFY